MTSSTLRVAVLYPELLGTYGDGGNVLVLRKRLAWRGLPADFLTVALRDPVPAECDLYVLGGGEDTAQEQALAAMRARPGLQRAAAAGATVLAVCAGLQMLGNSVTDREGRMHAGLGLLDASTVPRARRAVGELVAQPDDQLGLPLLTGFENHAGGTRLGPAARPLATVLVGIGNGAPGASAMARADEGAVQGSIVATYLHGPVLARNPGLADLVLSRALGRTLAPLSDLPAEAVRRERLRRLLRGRAAGAVPRRPARPYRPGQSPTSS